VIEHLLKRQKQLGKIPPEPDAPAS
jgi:hypothetical protein